ncbi:hypothetical protein [Streptomyces sp. NPDC002324]
MADNNGQSAYEAPTRGVCMRSIASGVVALTLAGSGLVAVAAPSYASCAPQKKIIKISNIKRIDKKTNLVSSAIQGPGDVSYSETTTATSSWGGSAAVEGDLSAIFASLKVKTEINHSKTWSKAKSWRYTLHIAKGKTQRIRMFHRHSELTVTKKTFNTGICKYRTTYKKRIHVPYSGNADNVWKRENV